MKFLYRITCLLLIVLWLDGCKKDHGILGVDVQPASDAVKTSFSDTATIYAHTISYDSTVSANGEYKFLGSNLDPYFGRTDVGLCLNANMNLTDLNFGPDATIHSAEIVLALNGLYYAGDPNALLSYSVFALDSQLYASRVYYTNNMRFCDKKTLLGTTTTSFTTYNGKLVIRIPVSNAFAGAMLTNPNFLTDNTTFQSNYKGFYITTSGTSLNGATQGAIYQCDLEDDVSGFYLYYQNGTPSAIRQDKVFQFTFSGTDAKRFNTVSYQPTQGGTSNLVNQIVGKDTTKGVEDLYLKGLGVTKVKIYIPSLQHYADSSQIAISRAELVFNVDPAFSAVAGYTVPPMLSLLPIDSLGRETYALDQVDASRYDGTYNSVTNQYVFNIARQAELITQGKVKNYGFYLVIANTQVLYAIAYDGPSRELVSVSRDDYIERVVIAGRNKGSLKPTFNLTYVKLKK